MKRRHLLSVAVAIAVVALAGCSLLGLGNPFVGTWTGEAFGPVSYAFDADMTFVDSGEDLWSGETYADPGVYAYTDERLTLTYDDGDVVEMFYDFRDGSLVLTPISGIAIGLVLTRAD